MCTNHLIKEQSPYLLQHAHNPVDWYPWCREAFERARQEDKPVFLSIGYSTCHWCHVMEQESFEDDEVAKILNQNYISVKVDREERPDVDGVYMGACLMMNESGGWPLTVLMTASQEPFFIGTYFPKEDRYGQVGLLHLLEQTAEKWKQDSGRLKSLAGEMACYLRQQEQGRADRWQAYETPPQEQEKQTDQNPKSNPKERTRRPDGAFGPSASLPKELLQARERGVTQLARMFDPTDGGFSGAPKFPVPHNLLFLLKQAEESIQKLQTMKSKGRRGQKQWRQTETEVLQSRETQQCAEGEALQRRETRQCAEPEGSQSQEQLLRAEEELRAKELLSMVEVTLNQMYRGGIFDHIGGGFSRYATDRFWLVPHFEKMLYDNALLALAYLEAYRVTGHVLLRQVAERTLSYMARELGHEKGGFFCGQDADSEGVEGKYYVFTRPEILRVLGKRAGEAFCDCYEISERGNFEGKSVPNLLQNEDYARAYDCWKEQMPQLIAYRRERVSLSVDDKILTSWNGLAIWAFARAYQITGVTEYYKRAKKAASFIRANLMTLNGRLKVRWRAGSVAFEGNLDDYAFFALSLLELYQCDFDLTWLRTCMQLSEKLLELFEDAGRGGCFFSGTAGETLITRPKETYDGAVPSGNSVTGLLLARLAHLTGEPVWREAARRQISFLEQEIHGREGAHTMALLALEAFYGDAVHLVCATKEEIPEEEIRCYRKRQKGFADAYVITEKNQRSLARLIPQAAQYPIQDRICYYLCQGGQCQAPVEELPKEME